MGSRTLPCQSPPHSKPASRKILITPGSIFPTVPWAFVSGLRSIAIPQECAESLVVPVRCGRNEKHPPKLVIFSCRPPLWRRLNTSAKTSARSLWESITVTVRDLPQESGKGKGNATSVRKSFCQRGSRVWSGRTYLKISPNVARIWSRPWGHARGAVGAGEFADKGSSVIIERFQLGRRFGL